LAQEDRTGAPLFPLPSGAWVLIPFMIAFFATATFYQLRSSADIWQEGSPMDMMHGSLLWAAAAMALVNAALRSARLFPLIIWGLAAAAIGLVAIDELFMLHEKSIAITGDDDHPKIFLIAAAGIGIFILSQIEPLHRLALTLFWCGFAAHCLYLVVDLGDGDYFTLPLSRVTLSWMEEYLEITSTAFYFSALFAQAFGVARAGASRN
jgi:hypothetical protein